MTIDTRRPHHPAPHAHPPVSPLRGPASPRRHQVHTRVPDQRPSPSPASPAQVGRTQSRVIVQESYGYARGLLLPLYAAARAHDHHDADPVELARLLHADTSHDAHFSWTAHLRNDVIGHVTVQGNHHVTLGLTLPRWRDAQIGRLVVHPDHRRRGVGTYLLRMLIDRFGDALWAAAPPGSDLSRLLRRHGWADTRLSAVTDQEFLAEMSATRPPPAGPGDPAGTPRRRRPRPTLHLAPRSPDRAHDTEDDY